MDHGEAPPGWEPHPADDTTYSFMLNTCQRVSVGNLERGPVSFVLETDWGLRPPDSCQEFEPGYDRIESLLGFWVNDSAVAGVLRDQLQIAVHLANIHVETMSQGDAETQTWTWNTEGSEESKLVAIHPGGSQTRDTPVYRLVWHNETGVRFLDLGGSFLLPNVPVPTSQGILAPPMRYSAAGESVPFNGLNAIWKTGDFNGPIYRFGDMECKKLLK